VPDSVDFDRVLLRAADDVARQPFYDAESGGPEQRLVHAFRSALDSDEEVLNLRSEAKYALLTWTRPPGGVDLAADLVDGTRALMEMKKDKPDEATWDVLKLLDILAQGKNSPPVAAAYLVYDATDRIWSTEDGAGLFTPPGQPWSARELIERWPNAWSHLLKGGYGIRPESCESAFLVKLILAFRLDAYPQRELRVIKVQARQDSWREELDQDGWPIGYRVPGRLRERGREGGGGKGGSSRPTLVGDFEPDPCHGYPWFRRWSKTRAVQVVQAMDAEDAYLCLRRRLSLERNWSEEELAPIDRAWAKRQ
jgi:hypothetical protein